MKVKRTMKLIKLPINSEVLLWKCTDLRSKRHVEENLNKQKSYHFLNIRLETWEKILSRSMHIVNKDTCITGLVLLDLIRAE